MHEIPSDISSPVTAMDTGSARSWTTPHRRCSTLAWSAAVLGLGLALAACSSSGADAGKASASGSTTGGSAAVTAKFASQLPASIRSAGVLSDVSSFDYPPYDNTDSGGKLVGGEVEILNAAAPLLGVKMQYKRLTQFSALIPAVTSGRDDMAGESIGITAERRKQVSFVRYGAIGEGLLVKAGNPSGVSATTVCGHSVATEAGAVENSFYATVSKACTSAGKKPVKIDVYGDEPSQVLSVTSGHDDAVGVGSTTVVSIAAGSKGKLVAVSGLVPGGGLAIGFVIPKSNPRLGTALASALTSLQQSGELAKINKKYNLASSLGVKFLPATG
jgi:polar amino acid transport system substrate-binding protein